MRRSTSPASRRTTRRRPHFWSRGWRGCLGIGSQEVLCDAAADVAHSDDTVRLIQTTLSIDREHRIGLLTFAFDARDPRWPAIRRRFRPREYVTRIYTVTWPDDDAAPPIAPPDG